MRTVEDSAASLHSAKLFDAGDVIDAKQHWHGLCVLLKCVENFANLSGTNVRFGEDIIGKMIVFYEASASACRKARVSGFNADTEVHLHEHTNGVNWLPNVIGTKKKPIYIETASQSRTQGCMPANGQNNHYI